MYLRFQKWLFKQYFIKLRKEKVGVSGKFLYWHDMDKTREFQISDKN